MFFLNYQNESMLDIKGRLSSLAELGKPREDFLYANIQAHNEDAKRKLMLKAQEYYINENDIVERKRYFIDRYGNPKEATNLTNSKLVHPFMRKLTKQKVNYLLARQFTISGDNTNFVDVLSKKYFDKKFYLMFKNLATDSIVNGIAWLQVYYTESGELRFKRIPPEEIIPFWADAEHTILEGLIRYYYITRYNPDSTQEKITKIEYYTSKGKWHYVLGPKGLKPDPDYKPNEAYGHFSVLQSNTDEEGTVVTSEVEAVWEKIPFVAFKYNAEEVSLLQWIKSLIDDYDVNSSDTSNNLQDIPNSIKVVKNYDGTDKGEFVQNLATFRTAFVRGDGDVTAVETKLDVAAIDSHLNRLRTDIYEAGSGVDTKTEELGNASGVSLKFRFADLSMDAEDFALELQSGLEELLWFIKVDMANKGLGTYETEEVEFVFNTDTIINESEVITDAKNSVGLISDDTIIANHPWVRDVAVEKDALKKQKADAVKLMQEDFNFPPQKLDEEGNSGPAQPETTE